MALQDDGVCCESGLAIVVMGVSGAGKTTIGKLLAEALGCVFLDADDFHSKENIEKMRNGVPLTDADRNPWLEELRNVLANYISQGKQVVLACSALRISYREILREAGGSPVQLVASQRRSFSPNSSKQLRQRRVVFVHLKGSFELIASRLEARLKDGTHYMPPSLLKSQLEVLEVSSKEDDIVTVDLSIQPAAIVESLVRELA